MLMTAHIAPCSFWMTLLTDALPLLEQKEVSRLVMQDKEHPLTPFLPDKVSQSGDPLSALRLGLALPVQKNCSRQFQKCAAVQVSCQRGAHRTQDKDNRLLTWFPVFRKQQWNIYADNLNTRCIQFLLVLGLKIFLLCFLLPSQFFA